MARLPLLRVASVEPRSPDPGHRRYRAAHPTDRQGRTGDRTRRPHRASGSTGGRRRGAVAMLGASTRSGSSRCCRGVTAMRSLVAERLGSPGARTALTQPGGNMSQSLVNRTARDIAAGRADVVLIGGAEAWRTRMAFRANDERPEWTVQDESVPGARDLRRSVRDDAPRRDGPRHRHAGAGVSDVRAGPAHRGRPHDRRPPRAHLRAVGAVQRGRGGEPERVDRRAYTAEEIRTAGPGQSVDRVPVSRS